MSTINFTARAIAKSALGSAMLAALVLAVSGTAQAAIVMSNLTSGTLAANDAGGDAAKSTTSSYTVSAGNILVVQLDLYSTNNTGAQIAPTITYNGSPLTMLAQTIGLASGYPQTDIFVLNSPTVGTNNLVVNFTARSAAFGAMELSGVNTSATPGTASTISNSAVTPNVLNFSGANAAGINGSFAVVTQASRDSGANNYILGTNAAGAAASQLFNYWGGSQFQAGGGTVSSIPAGAFTISSTQTTYNQTNNRFVTAGVVFAPTIGTTTWTGTAGNGNWDVNTTKNWQNANTGGFYLEPNNGVLFDDTAGAAAGTPSVSVTQVVKPQSVVFNNNSYPYTLTASGGSISGAGAVTLSGTGLVNMNLANSYSGGTNVNSGTLAIGNGSGSATGSGPVAIAAGATLSGNGFISTSGANVVSVSGSITPDLSPGAYNTLTASALNLNSGSALNLSFSTTLPGQHDLVNVTGALNLGSGTVNINVANLSGTWTPGAYPFLNYNSLAGSPTFNLVNVAGALGSSQMSIDESVNHVISLDILSAAASNTLSWVGNQNGGLWDIGSTLNWTSSGNASVYNEGNRVVFSNTASNFAVTVNQQVNPSGVTFSNSSNSYTLSGGGGINSTTLGVAINGGGIVTFNNTNNYTSATTVTNGSTLTVNGSLPNSSVLVTGAFIGGNGQLAASPASLTLNGTTGLTAGSNLSVYGATNVVGGVFTIPAATTLSGTGGINVSPGAQLTVNGIVDVSQVVALSSATLSGSGTLNGGLTNSGTSNIASGIISAAGAWTGSGTINVSSGAELLLGGAASTAGLTLNVSGSLDGTSGAAVNGPVIVSGSGVASINAGTMPSLTALGGTTSLAGATVSVATVSGTNAVVNVTSGSVPILNVTNSNLTSGVTIGSGASACTTSASVSGGLVTLNDFDTIPIAVFSGGTTNLNAPTVTAGTISGASTVFSASGGQVSRFTASGGSATIGSLASAFTATVSGNAVVNLNNSNTMPILTASGGTINFAGPSGTVATISGTNTVVNITAGSIPTLNVVNSNLTSGVTVSSGASAGSTALSVSGGLVTMNNFDTIPTSNISGGTTNFSGPSLTVANISGTAVVNVNTAGVATLNVSGSGTTTVSSSASVTSAGVSGGLVNLNPTSGLSQLVVGGGRVNVSSTSALSVLSISGGTVNLPVGTTTVATVNFSGTGAAAALVTPNPLVVSNKLTFNGGASATVSGGTFGYVNSSGNLANTSAPNTLTFSGGVLTFSPSLSAGQAINVDAAHTAYTGLGPAPDAGTTWNAPVLNATNVALLNSSGATTSVTYTATGQAGPFGSGNPNGLLSEFSAANGMTFTFGALTPGVQYGLYAIQCNDNNNRWSTYTATSQLGNPSISLSNPTTHATVLVTDPSVSGVLTGLTPNGSNQIIISVGTTPGQGNTEGNANGFQLIPFNVPSGSVNLPSTSVVATTNSTLDFSGAGPANALGGLSLAGNATVQNVSSGGSVQFGGDVVASTNATISLAAGTGSVPTLVLSGNTSGIQNISTANATTLTLPPLSISAPTVRFNASGGTGSVVVLSGPTVLSNVGGTALTINAGTLKVSSTLSGAAGASVQINAGTTLAGGPAGSIQVPVTVSPSGVLKPDATAASTALIGNSLTINGGGRLQWIFNNSGAKGTIALGSGTLNLPDQFSGQPVLRPQFITAPALGTFVMTWNSPPANQPTWGFDGSLAGNGATAMWGDSNDLWDTGSNWIYPNYTGGTLSYQPTGLQLTGLSVTNVTGTSAPATGANVLIAPPSNSNVSVTGPSVPVSIGTLLIEGSNSATASLTLQGGGPISPTTASVFAGGALTADADALNLPTGILTISQGSVSLGSASTNVGAATINSGVLSLGGGTIGTLTASGGAIGVSGATVASAQVSGTAAVNATGGAFTLLAATGGNTTVGSGASVGAATVNSNAIVNLDNTNTMTSLLASGGTTTLAGPTVTVATVSGNAVVIVSAGDVPTLNVTSSDPNLGVTVSNGASAGDTLLNVSGGRARLSNTNIIPTATLSGGSTTLAGPAVTVANISGGSTFVNISAGSVATLNVASSNLSSGITVGPGASVGSTALSVSGGLVTLNNTNTIPTAAFSGGTTNLAGPTVTSAAVSASALVNVNVANTVSGATLISGGTVNVADPAGLGLQQSTVTLNSNNSLSFSHSSATLGGLTGFGNLTLPSNVLKVGANCVNTNYGGTLMGAGGLTKIGTGTLLLTSSNAYSGPTLVDAGTLKLASGVTGFGGTGTGWTVNNNAISSPPFTNNVLTLTDNTVAQSRSAWYNTPVGVGPFTASFVYTVGGSKIADGMTFCLQTDPRGLAALGGNGGNIGYGNAGNGNQITPSLAIGVDFFNTSRTGAAPFTGGVVGAYIPTAPVSFTSGDPIQVTLTYTGANLVENFLDLSNAAAFSTTYLNVNLAGALGGSTTAYIGFTGGDNALSTQTISNFSFGLGGGTAGILPTSTPLLVSANAMIDLGGVNQIVASLSDGNGGGGTVTNSVASSVLTLAPTGSTTFSGSIVDGSGTVALALNGPGTQVLSGTNTYSGGTTVNNGTLIVTNIEALADGSSLTVGSASPFQAAIVPAPPASAPVASVPEPGTLALVAAAGLAVAVLGRKRLRR